MLHQTKAISASTATCTAVDTAHGTSQWPSSRRAANPLFPDSGEASSVAALIGRFFTATQRPLRCSTRRDFRYRVHPGCLLNSVSVCSVGCQTLLPPKQLCFREEPQCRTNPQRLSDPHTPVSQDEAVLPDRSRRKSVVSTRHFLPSLFFRARFDCHCNLSRRARSSCRVSCRAGLCRFPVKDRP